MQNPLFQIQNPPTNNPQLQSLPTTINFDWLNQQSAQRQEQPQGFLKLPSTSQFINPYQTMSNDGTTLITHYTQADGTPVQMKLLNNLHQLRLKRHLRQLRLYNRQMNSSINFNHKNLKVKSKCKNCLKLQRLYSKKLTKKF